MTLLDTCKGVRTRPALNRNQGPMDEGGLARAFFVAAPVSSVVTGRQLAEDGASMHCRLAAEHNLASLRVAP